MNDLIEREIKLLKLVCKDLSNFEIAQQMGISLRFTEKIKKSLYTKTKTSSNLGLFKWALKHKYTKYKY